MKQEEPGLPAEGCVRLKQILGPRGPIPVSKSTWWAGVASGRFPRPVKLGPRTTAWRVEDIRALLAAGHKVDDNSLEFPANRLNGRDKGDLYATITEDSTKRAGSRQLEGGRYEK